MTAPPSHFAQRCAERGIHSVAPHTLRAEIEKAVAATIAGDAHADFVEHVMAVRDDAALWRFRVREGVFYAIVVTEPRIQARTVITQEMLVTYKAQRKGGHSRREFEFLQSLGLSVKAAKRRNFSKFIRENKGAKP